MDQSAFETAAAQSLAAIYSQQGTAAIYTPYGGSPVSVTVLVDERTRTTQDRSSTRNRVHRLRGCVRVSEVSDMQRGDTFQLGGEDICFTVVPSSVENDGLEWTFEAHADVTKTVGDVRTMPDT